MRNTVIVFGVTAFVVSGSALLTYSAGQRVMRLNAAEAKRQEMLADANDLFSTLQDAETGQRGYIITGNESYLEPFIRAEDRFPGQLDRLNELSEFGISPAQLRELQTRVRDKMSELRHTIDLRRSGGFGAVLPVIEAGAGKESMDRIRELFATFRSQEERLIEEDRQRSRDATALRTATFLGTSVLSLAVLLWAAERIRRALQERSVAAAKLTEERELLSTTLSSIGDCVIVTDASGNITFMNPVAVKVTGWSESEALGKPLREVFHIINEQTRKEVEDPVAKVIRSGMVVGLANHTLLVRKDGTEIPIDDSGAPVRSVNGELHGVVLVFRDFSEARRAQSELLAAKEEAETANTAKDTFLAMLSHELRTPLTPVLAILQAWQLAGEVPESLRNDIQMLRRNIELETRLIDDLLDLTRISRGVFSFRTEIADVHEIINLLISMMQSEVEQKKLAVSLNLEATRHHVQTDPSRLQQLLWNILRNAANYSDIGARIKVETADEGEHIRITITDSGIGMTRETLRRLFTPFEQADRARSLRYGGLGLGLAISHALVEQMGGEIEADSAGLGRGSTFTVRLRVADASAKSAPQAIAAPRHTPRRILLVEDHADSALALARLLTLRGDAVHTAASVKEAETALASAQFDLLICDIGLPDGTGYDLMNDVRARSNMPAIALTGFGMQSDIERAAQAGFDTHVSKPVSLQQLESAIAQAERSASAKASPS